MRDAGWDEDVAADAMETTLQEHLNELAVQKGEPSAGACARAAGRFARPAERRRPPGAGADATGQTRVVVFGNFLRPRNAMP